MNRERRQYQRKAVTWDADLSGPGFGPLAFEITDFCDGGLFLVPATRTADNQLRQQGVGTTRIRVGLADPVSGRRRQVEATVVRVSEQGFGIAFAALQPELTGALDTIAASARSAQSAAFAADKRKPIGREQQRRGRDALRQCVDLIGSFLDGRLQAFTSQAEGALFQAAETAASNPVQAAHFGGIRMLKKHRHQFTHDIRELAVANWLDIGRFAINPEQDVAATADQLSLVDEGDFEDWLQRSEVISRAETRAIRSLRYLHRRLAVIADTPIDEYSNPISPVALCHHLADQLAIFRPDRASKGVIYQSFGKALLNQLGVLYDGINERLREAGVLPDLEDERLYISKVRDAHRSRPSELDQGAVERESGASTDDPGVAQAPLPGSGFGSLYRTVRDLFRASRQEAGGEAAAEAPPAHPATPQLASQAAASLPMPPAEAGTQAPPLREQLQNQIQTLQPGEGVGLAPEQVESVDLLESWFSELRPDVEDGGFFREWSHRLVPLALAEEMRDGSFLQQRDRPIHQLIDALDRAANAMAAARPADRESLRARLTPALEQAVAAGGAAEQLAEAAEALDSGIERSRKIVDAGMERVRQACEGSQRLSLARECVEEALLARLGEGEIPSPLLRLIEEGWRNHLVLVELRHGQDSAQWQRGLKAVDILLAGLGSEDVPRRRVKEPQKLFAYIHQALAQTNRPPAEIGALVGELERWLAEPLDGPYPPSGRFEAVEVGQAAEPTSAEELPEEWLGRAKLLNPGDWVQLPDSEGTPTTLRLAWVSRGRDRFVFVNRAGQRAAELKLPELALALGELDDPGEDLNTPATMRRWQDMLLKLNRQLSHQATHDPLTGLLNRKAMQRRIRYLLEHPKATGMQHVFCQFAMDDFKVVNNTVGHEGGDETLRQVAELLQDEAGKRLLIARMGGDEFAVLMVRTKADDARTYVERQLARLRERRFGTERQPIRLTASAGLVPFDRKSHDEEALLRDADNAVFRAKESGGNRYHIVRPDDADLADLQLSMNQATRVDLALESGGLQLRCQRIMPLQDAQLLPMFEVLISLADGDKENLRPDQFIPAAERFGRMPALDRWVIREVFDWYQANPDSVRGLGALSINLSGQTLNDVGFLDYLKSQFDSGRVDSAKICFEVTETAAMANLAVAADLIRELKQLGCRFALDDFGSGLSSYSYLKNLPADFLKIDGEFIRDLDSPGSDDAMVRSIHELCHHLGKVTVAEFVESDSIRRRLQSIGLDYAQGFGIERPILLEDLEPNAMYAT
ncbi:diguanylate cyclase (GGDEF)-like protein [Natronocella acetinitrilica]|uniref:Diguanylate cyclase (GGDEF)-like protein n=1 Tax=Natronocella acetinitrilica TaxID=414046 RepID=A0AAE3G3I6_9GAMM|nr:DUF1631 family protein [Natronocella acetinitrilica]MCP1674051.1 diguanylate cyclase (GGDEF)-like protein [Natronocella acetinitrilica]